MNEDSSKIAKQKTTSKHTESSALVSFYRFINKLLTFIKYARVSLFFIIIIILLITKIEMGGDIVISLFENPLNLLLTLILIIVIAVPTSHYPLYFRIRDEMKNSAIDENYNDYIFCINQNPKKFKKVLERSPFRIIYYRRKNNPSKDAKNQHDNDLFYFSIFRRSMGVSLFIAFIYILLDNCKTYLNQKFSVFLITLLLSLALVAFLIGVSLLKKKAFLAFANTTENAEMLKEAKEIVNFRKVVMAFYWFSWLSILALIATTTVVYYYKWQLLTIITTVITLVILALTFILFSVSRSWLKYVFYSSGKELASEDNDPNYLNTKYKDAIDSSSKERILGIKLWWFSDNITYLRGFAIAGILLVFFLVYLNTHWQIINRFNFITVFLVIYMVYYGLFIIYLKHRMHAKFSENSSTFKFKKFWKLYSPLLLALFLGIAISSVVRGNDLHYIPNNINRNPHNEIALPDFEEAIKTQQKHLFVSSYGGGLKSNLWTMLVLDKLERNNTDFLNSVRCLSGVSGGGVGFANYMLLDTDAQKREQQINRIAKYNFVSLDLTFLLGKDLIREYIPNFLCNFNGKDRAYYGMKQHLMALKKGQDTLANISFYDVYAATYKKRKYYPPLIINTVSTNGIQGISFSIPIEKGFDSIFPGAINILDASPTTTLRYLGAVSPTNRFPILSPSASIEGKGHFIDGGAFDNSGILSTENWKNYLVANKAISEKNQEVYFINISVSKSSYIKRFIKKYGLTTRKISASGELPAIIGTASATEGLPKYISQKLKDYNHFYQIVLPHTFTFEDLEKELGGKLYLPENSTKQQLLEAIACSNNAIKKLIENNTDDCYLKNLVVQPATGRLMSRPSINYQKIMLKHPSVVEQFTAIKKILKQ